MENTKIITRFAPSPTGHMHVGGARTALYAYLLARKEKGTFILRIEDTDKIREVDGSIEHLIESLKWLGISWDEGIDIGGPNAPYLQSERLESYRKYAQILVDKGMAYTDPYTKEELEDFRMKAEQEKRPFLYRDHRPENPPVWDGTMPLRLKITDVKISKWFDEVRGELTAGPEALDDFILIKSDGYPTYNLAHIIDDLEMGVTHIMRSDEFISSTPKYLALYDALNIEHPAFVTLPPIMSQDGKKKLGKRDGAKDILDYKREGYLPSAVMNFIAFIGWNPGGEKEIYTRDELIEAFSIDKIHKSGGQFNEEKLQWMNREHLKLLSYEEQEEYINNYLPEDLKNSPSFNTKILHDIVPIIMDRISCGKDITTMAENGELSYFFQRPSYDRDSLFFKNSKTKIIEKDDKYIILSSCIERLINKIEEIEDFKYTKETLKESIMPYADTFGRGDVLWPMRYILSGAEKSPDPFTLASILGKEETLIRLRESLDIIGK